MSFRARRLEAHAGLRSQRGNSLHHSQPYPYATNAANLRLQLADMPDEDSLIIR